MRAASRLVLVVVSAAGVVNACTETPSAVFYEVIGGSAGAAGAAGRAGEPSSRGGAPPAPDAGDGGVPSLVEEGGAGGALVTPQGGSGPVPNVMAGRGGVAGTGSIDPPKITACERQLDLLTSVENVRIRYRTLVAADCRVAQMLWNVVDDGALDAFADQLARYGAWLWGCEGAQKEVAFGIAYQPLGITQGDADVLIDHYLTSADEGLGLVSGEIDAMREVLEADAEDWVASASTTEFTFSTCPPPIVGEGGAGGMSGAGGAGGQGGAAGQEGGSGGGT